MDKQAKKAREQMKNLSFQEKCANFWYYHKVHIFLGALVLLLVLYTAVECSRQVDYDLQISYYSATPIYDEATGVLSEELKANVDDINLNGSTDIFIASCYANPADASEQTQATMMKLSAELAAGENNAYIIDEVYYNTLKNNYPECFESYTDISEKESIKKAFGLENGEKLYFAVRTLYDNEKDKNDCIKAHNNAIKAREYLENLK